MLYVRDHARQDVEQILYFSRLGAVHKDYYFEPLSILRTCREAVSYTHLDVYKRQPQPPALDCPVLENPTADKPILENPTPDKPTTENPTQLNKDIQKTDLPKKEKSNTDLSNTDSIPILSPNPSPYAGAVPFDRLEDETVAWAEKMMEHSPLALRMIKAGLNADLDGQAGIQALAGDATCLLYTSRCV